jgi:hypothetical protein
MLQLTVYNTQLYFSVCLHVCSIRGCADAPASAPSLFAAATALQRVCMMHLMGLL